MQDLPKEQLWHLYLMLTHAEDGSCQEISITSVISKSEHLSVTVQKNELVINVPGDYAMSLLNLNGRKIYTSTGTGPERKMLPDLKIPGIHIIDIKTAGMTHRQKVMLLSSAEILTR